ncbi:hypothetical protein BGW36DRAFT_435586 [Talaromyces proteolyticus]|uniref:Zn(2)-C6 fungal-type domain-containing protein n=1 Tax=Talaromyces proteolyticus TaxID=1131652 RepID=A0AAD4Q6G1_9EURO|nr:uncharacterized protein BGW36DRAFT_435586 [Talaromyces proteolyticus]KAH8705671.1 hypothetical protein BGW36DRAFT_435586 [Talaromyces proteolyticus]
MKAPRACWQCRQSKRKCSSRGPCEPCVPCQRRHLQCGLEPAGARYGTSHRPAENSLSSKLEQAGQLESVGSDDQDLAPHLAIHLVELYLEEIHDRTQSIFHAATLRVKVKHDDISSALLYAICALGSKFWADPERRDLEPRLTEAAKRFLQADLENICVENIQTCIILANLSAGNGQTQSQALYLRIASSMAEILHLDSPHPDAPIIEREISRKIWWSLYFADRLCFSGLGLRCRVEDVDDQSSNITWKPGIWAQLVKLGRHLVPIQDLNRRIATGVKDTSKVDLEMENLKHELEAWSRQLPPEMQMSIQNLIRQEQNGIGGAFVTLHLTYHHFSTLLYFRFLEGRQCSSADGSGYIALCKHHASSFSSLLHLSRQIKGCRANCPTIAHMTAVSSSVLVHSLLFGGPEDLHTARQELKTNFEALIDLQYYWPATEAMINRLMAFQSLCLLSTESHKLDGWMVRYLLEHSLALEERNLPIKTSNADMESESMISKTRDLQKTGRYTDLQSLADKNG